MILQPIFLNLILIKEFGMSLILPLVKKEKGQQIWFKISFDNLDPTIKSLGNDSVVSDSNKSIPSLKFYL
jgi:hypothetical protein